MLWQGEFIIDYTLHEGSMHKIKQSHLQAPLTKVARERKLNFAHRGMFTDGQGKLTQDDCTSQPLGKFLLLQMARVSSPTTFFHFIFSASMSSSVGRSWKEGWNTLRVSQVCVKLCVLMTNL